MNLIRNSVAQLGSEQHALMQRELETRAAIKVIGEERKRAGVEEIRLENEHVAGVSYRRTVSPISLTRENLAAQDSEATPRAKAHLKAPSSSSSHSSRMSNALQQARQAAIDAKSDHAVSFVPFILRIMRKLTDFESNRASTTELQFFETLRPELIHQNYHHH